MREFVKNKKEIVSKRKAESFKILNKDENTVLVYLPGSRKKELKWSDLKNLCQQFDKDDSHNVYLVDTDSLGNEFKEICELSGLSTIDIVQMFRECYSRRFIRKSYRTGVDFGKPYHKMMMSE